MSGFPILGIVLMTIWEMFGNFGTLATDSETSSWEQWLSYALFNVIWLVFIWIMTIIFTNFLIASVSDTFTRVLES
jgi:protein-S-isoprenylcysteine O-methyltransferase Ste14